VPPARLPSLLNQACWYNDEPLAHASDAHLLAISRHAKPRVTVLLSGEGADETLGGYVRYRPLRYPSLLATIRLALPGLSAAVRNRRWKKLTRLLKLGSLRDVVLYNACDTLPEDLTELGLTEPATLEYRQRALSEAEHLYPGELVRQAMYVDQHTFLCSVLDRNDRMTMGASIECRTPFLDHRLVEGLAALPTSALFAGTGDKSLLRRSVGDRLPTRNLRHRKWGFGVPWHRYVNDVPELRHLLTELPRNQLVMDAPLDPRRLRRQLDLFWKGDGRCFPTVLALLMTTQAWEGVTAGIAAATAEGVAPEDDASCRGSSDASPGVTPTLATRRYVQSSARP
jgi:asparagine synthase (glutamine-hydrolysing)